MVDPKITSLFHDIYDSTSRKVFAFLTARCKNLTDAHDLFQDTYTELYAALIRHGTHYVKNGEAFVMRLARQKLSRYYSLRDRLKSVEPLLCETEDGDEINLADLENQSVSFEDAVDASLIAEEINRRLSEKPADVQKIFFLYYTMEMTVPQIAKALFMRESTVKNKLYRTLNELRKLYAGKDGTSHD